MSYAYEARVDLDLSHIAGMLRGAASGETVAVAAYEALRISLGEMLDDVKRNKLSGQYLKVRSGDTRESMGMKIFEFDAEKVVGALGSTLRGGVRAHEEGFTGFVQVSAYVRRLLNPASSRQRLRMSRGQAYSQRVTTTEKPNAVLVRPHRRLMVIREKRFIRASIWEGIPTLEKRVARALLHVLETGSVPPSARLL